MSAIFRFRRSLSCSTVAALAILAPPAGALLVPADLQLDKAPSFEIPTEPAPNSHEKLTCTRCHVESDVDYETGKKYGIKIPLKIGDDSPSILCEECHSEFHSFHPVDFKVTRGLEKIEREGLFPLYVPLEGINKLTCLTCHDLHSPHTGHRLLRGFPVGSRLEKGQFANRLEFCNSCHEGEVFTMSGHGKEWDYRTCGQCHLGYKDPRDPGPLKRRINESCSVCHPFLPGERPHFYSFNPFPDYIRQELPDYGLFLTQGRFTCSVCHQHHREEGQGTFLRPAYIGMVSKSSRVNPHLAEQFCRNCHSFNPPPPGTAGAKAPLWEEDITRLCRGCHSKKGALQMIHPLGRPAQEMSLPEGWPLRKSGLIGCETCHVPGHSSTDKGNANYLREGNYQGRNDICFRCHRAEKYRGRNIHDEVKELGGCEFCHIVKERTALRPEGKVGDLLAEANLLCLLCHSTTPHPASAKHTVKPTAHTFVQIDEELIPMSLGKISCHSCHDAHSPDAERLFLRGSGGSRYVCQACHPF